MTTVVTHDAERLRELLATYSLKVAPEGQPFILASGQESLIYFDVKNVSLAPEAILLIGKLFTEVAENYGATAVGGLVAGAIPIAAAVVAHLAVLGRTDIRGFYVRDEAKTHGTKELLYQAFDPSRADGITDPTSRVVVVDDVLTSGKSISDAMNVILARGAKVEAIVVLVDRVAGGAQALRARYGVPVVALYQMGQDGVLTYVGREVA